MYFSISSTHKKSKHFWLTETHTHGSFACFHQLKFLSIECNFLEVPGFTNNNFTLVGFQPVLHDWCNKGCGMYYPICWMVHIKEPLLLIGKMQRDSSHHLSGPIPYNRK